MPEFFFKNGCATIKNVDNFDLAQTLDCGQAFRWHENSDGSWSGIAYGKYITVSKKDNTVFIHNTTKDEFNGIWRTYFDFDRDYSGIIRAVSDNETVKKVARFSSGIRVLNQEPFETLCSFIISQNNNIPRIKGIIERLCENFGEKINGGYTFPTAGRLASLTLEDLAVLRAGFRAKYILDAAKKVSGGEIVLEDLIGIDTAKARNTLLKINGVGPKVADCTLLFSLHHITAFPQDVWIKKAMAELFNGTLPESSKPFAGIVQQYIFYYMRVCEYSR